MNGWRLPVRLAWRDALRHKWRTALIVMLIALPVCGATVVSTMANTLQITGSERIDQRLGAADAEITWGGGRMQQGSDPMKSGWGTTGGPQLNEPTEASLAATLTQVLGAGTTSLPITRTNQLVQLGTADDAAVLEANFVQGRLDDPKAAGMWRLDSGRWPTKAGEVVITPPLRELGVKVGDTVRLVPRSAADSSAAQSLSVVGEGVNLRPFDFSKSVVAFPGTLPEAGISSWDAVGALTWLIDSPDPVTWDDVRTLNEAGFVVTSRAVLVDPPKVTTMSAGESDQGPTVALTLAAVLLLLEVVLLAGPAFAVGSRRQARTIALLSTNGATPSQARAVVLASALVLGCASALVGLIVGLLIVGGYLLVVPDDVTSVGPFDPRFDQLLIIVAAGVLSALASALIPAHRASAADPVATLAGRRRDDPVRLRNPVIGLLLVGAGIAGSTYGAWRLFRVSHLELLLALSAVAVVIGLIFVVPTALVALAKVSGRWPFAWRYAARDSSRHRSRTVPAVAAVAAVVAGVTALGIGNASDDLQGRAEYQPGMAMGVGAVTAFDLPDEQWARLEAMLRKQLPQATLTTIQGVVHGEGADFIEVTPKRPVSTGQVSEVVMPINGYSSSMGASTVVAPAVPAAAWGLSAQQAAAADAMLQKGGVVVFANPGERVDAVDLELASFADGARWRRDVPAYAVPLKRAAPVGVVMPPTLAEQLDLSVGTTAIAITGDLITAEKEQQISDQLRTQWPYAGLMVERGYQSDTPALLWVLAAVAAVLMLGGTLTATGLALNDARGDFATVSAVGGTPSTRRTMAAATALIISGLGAVHGAVVGLMPGIALSRLLTYQDGIVSGGPGWFAQTPGAPQSYLDIPWLLVLGVVVGVPLLAAAVMAAVTRPRLELPTRLS